MKYGKTMISNNEDSELDISQDMWEIHLADLLNADSRKATNINRRMIERYFLLFFKLGSCKGT